MKYYIISGEASGDLHGADLMKHLKAVDKNAEFRFWGGDLMLAENKNIAKHYKDLAFMGIVDVLKNIRKISNNLKFCKSDILINKPDVIIFIDYPGFNLRIAEFAKKNNFKTIYYISPKIWAWKKSRAKKIKKFIDKMFVIFPFEKQFYKQFDYEVEYVGNPNVDVIENKKKLKIDKSTFFQQNNIPDKPIIALLAGSRKQEIERLLPEMLETTKKFKNYQFVIAGVSFLNKNLYSKTIEYENVSLIFDQTYQLLQHSNAALVTSGTATLETALFKIPQIVCYKTEIIFYYIAKLILKIKYISLVNIISNKEVVKEIIQNNVTEKMIIELNKILNDKQYRLNMLNNYDNLIKILGESGSPLKTAEYIFKYIFKN